MTSTRLSASVHEPIARDNTVISTGTAARPDVERVLAQREILWA